MGLFKSKQQKEIEKKMLIKRTINTMNKQINKLEDQKRVFIEAAKRAKQRDLDAQFNRALSGYKMTVQQQKRAQEMLLNFEITSQMRDVTMMTSEFLRGMSDISKEMSKLADAKEFAKIQTQFEEAMAAVETQTDQMDNFMEMSQQTFYNQGIDKSGKQMSDDELEKFILEQASQDEFSSENLDKEMEEIRKKIESDSSK